MNFIPVLALPLFSSMTSPRSVHLPKPGRRPHRTFCYGVPGLLLMSKSGPQKMIFLGSHPQGLDVLSFSLSLWRTAIICSVPWGAFLLSLRTTSIITITIIIPNPFVIVILKWQPQNPHGQFIRGQYWDQVPSPMQAMLPENQHPWNWGKAL